jgi:hypothetical protein
MKEDIKRAVLSSQQHVRSKRSIAVEMEEDTSGTVFGSVTFPQAKKKISKAGALVLSLTNSLYRLTYFDVF